MKTINNYICEKILISKNTNLYYSFDDFMIKHGFTFNQDDSTSNINFYNCSKNTCLKYYNKIKDHYNDINDINNHPSVYEKYIDLDEKYNIGCVIESNGANIKIIDNNLQKLICKLMIFIDNYELAYWKGRSIINDKELVKYFDEKMILLLEKIFDN